MESFKTQVDGDHYKHMAIHPTEYCQRNRLNFCESAVVKYVSLHASKGGRKDIEKAIHFLEMLLDLEYPINPERRGIDMEAEMIEMNNNQKCQCCEDLHYGIVNIIMKPWQKFIHEAIRTLQHAVHKNAQEHGWYEGPARTDAELIALEHSELSEALDALRNGNPESEKIPGFSHAEEEFADVVIRIADHCEYRGWNLAGAILAKHEYNKSRPHRHGGKLF